MPVEVQELPCREGHIGLLTLNAPDTLNALTEEMIVQAQEAWMPGPRAIGSAWWCYGGW